MDVQKLLPAIFDFMKDAGVVALEKQSTVTGNLKPDATIVTEADLAITALFYERFGDYLNRDDTAVLDEETDSAGKTEIDKATYIWSLDPVDGTTTYFNGLPLWGISLGILKDKKPWLGFVYLPALRELFYCDGDKPYLVKEAFQPNEKTQILQPSDPALTKKDIYYAPWVGYEYNFKTDLSPYLLDLYAGVIHLSFVCAGRGKGMFFGIYIWDLAGIWPLAEKLGLGFFDAHTDEKLDHLDFNRFQDNWRINGLHIFCHNDNLGAIKKLLA